MPRKDVVALELIRHHFAIEPELRAVYHVVGDREGETGEPIKLLEINAATPATGSVDVFGFAPTREVPYAVQIAEITPEELERLTADPTLLPPGWDLDRARIFPRPKAA